MTTHYNAFISYRHCPLDSKIAAEVQHQLEHMKIPKAIAEKTGIGRIDRIFRDKEELPITSDLNDDIADALANSDRLIVICSPRLKESVWCMREIENFLKNHDKNQILTVLAEGDEPSEVIPQILLEDGREPLSCDYRLPFRKARREELPRLAAGILGCRYDDLVQRQKMYRQRRMLTAMAAGLMLTAAFAGYAINRARIISKQADQIEEDYRNTLIAQSQNLSSQANKALEDSDTKLAIQLALAALPSEENDRPWTPEAELALTRGLNLYANSTIYYQTSAKYTAYGTVERFHRSGDGAYIALLDDQDYVCVYRTDTAEKIWEAVVSDRGTMGSVLTPDDHLVVNASNLSSGSIRCYELLTGNLLWETEPMLVEGALETEVEFLPTRILRIEGSSDVLAMSSTNAVRIDGRTGRPLWKTRVKEAGEASALLGAELEDSTTPDGRYAVMSMNCGYGEARQCSAVLLDLADGSYRILPGAWCTLMQAEFLGNDELLLFARENYDDGYSEISDEFITDVIKYDLRSGAICWSIPVKQYSYAYHAVSNMAEGRDLILAMGRTVLRMDRDTGEVIKLIQVGENTIGGWMADDGTQILFTDSGSFYSYDMEKDRIRTGKYMNLPGSFKQLEVQTKPNRFYALRYLSHIVYEESNVTPDSDYKTIELSQGLSYPDSLYSTGKWTLAATGRGISCVDLDRMEEAWYWEAEGETLDNSYPGWRTSPDGSVVYLIDYEKIYVIRPAAGTVQVCERSKESRSMYGRWSFEENFIANEAGLIAPGYSGDQCFLVQLNADTGVFTNLDIPQEIRDAMEVNEIGDNVKAKLTAVGEDYLISTSTGKCWHLSKDLSEAEGWNIPTADDSLFAWDAASSDVLISAGKELNLAAKSGECLRTISLKYAPAAVTFSEDGKELLLVDVQDYLRRYDREGNLLASYDLADPRKRYTPSDLALQWLPAGELCIRETGRFTILEAENKKPRCAGNEGIEYIYNGNILTTDYVDGITHLIYYPMRTVSELRALGEAAVAGLSIPEPEQYGLQ